VRRGDRDVDVGDLACELVLLRASQLVVGRVLVARHRWRVGRTGPTVNDAPANRLVGDTLSNAGREELVMPTSPSS